MKKPQTTACSSCGEPIYFAKTSSGKPMPVDAEPSDQGNVLLALDADTRQLKAEVLGRGTEPPAGRNVYLSHFVTCPHSESHRKAHRGQRPFDAPKLAITLHSPWAQCIIYGTKRVENRTWKPPAKVRGERLVIHCGKTDDKEKWAELRDSDIGYTPTEENWHAGHIIGSVRVIGVRKNDQVHMFGGRPVPDGLAGDTWYMPDHYGWLLDEIEVYKPIPVRGYQKVWHLKNNDRHKLTLLEDAK